MSWEGHLSGGVTGLLSAIIFRNYGPQKPEEPEDEELEDDEEEDNVMAHINAV